MPYKTGIRLLGVARNPANGFPARLLASILTACGPSAEYHEGQTLAQQAQQEDATPEPCDRTEGTYSRLDETLVDLVGQYERCEKTEEEAAAMAPEHHGNMVLAQTDVTGDVNVVDGWLEAQGAGPKVAIDYTPPNITSFVRVTLLGELAAQTGVSQVTAVPTSHLAEAEPAPPGLVPARARSEDDEPEVPWWINGYRYPGSYLKLKDGLPDIAGAYAKGTLDLDQLSENRGVGCFIKGDKVWLELHISDEEEVKTRVMDWLNEINADFERNFFLRTFPGEIVIPATVPISRLEDVETHPDVTQASQGLCGGMSPTTEPTGNWQRNLPNLLPASRFGTVVTQGVRIHNADEWHTNTPTQYRANGVKIGIIDNGFKGLADK